MAHIFAAAGLIGLAVLPEMMQDKFFAIIISVSVYVVGGGTAMFALLALAGNLGCSLGPTYVGIMSEIFNDDLKKGIFMVVIFPVVLIITLFYYNKKKAYKNK